MWVSQFSGVNSPSEVQNLGINQKSRANSLGLLNYCKFLLLIVPGEPGAFGRDYWFNKLVLSYTHKKLYSNPLFRFLVLSWTSVRPTLLSYVNRK